MRKGFTLIELLVAMTVFVLLGLCLAYLLRGTIEAWRMGHFRQLAEERIAAVQRQLQEDLAEMVACHVEDGGPPVGRFSFDLAGPDLSPRLRLVRSLGRMGPDAARRLGGASLGARGAFDRHDDGREALRGDLRASGALVEVGWTVLPGTAADALWRAVRAPSGEPEGLFADAALAHEADIKRRGQELVDGLLFFNLEFWTPHTRDWDEEPLERKQRLPPADPEAWQGRGPALVWDSTRGRDPSFPYFAAAASLADGRDDIFPAAVRLELVVEEGGPGTPDTFLLQAIDAGERELVVDRARALGAVRAPYGRIDREWLLLEGTRAGRYVVAADGRGRRGTVAAPHAALTPVKFGRRVVVTFSAPGVGTGWRER